MSNTDWRVFTEPRPYCTISVVAYDDSFTFPILFRGPGVRSARNVWSIPSGLHEVGLTIEQQAIAELGEELNIEAVPGSYRHVGLYENILVDETPKSHWVIDVGVIRVKTLDTLVNKEPDKHPKIEVVSVTELRDPDFFKRHAFAPVLAKFLRDHAWDICDLVIPR